MKSVQFSNKVEIYTFYEDTFDTVEEKLCSVEDCNKISFKSVPLCPVHYHFLNLKRRNIVQVNG